ncbi:MAG: VOC family protein [Rhizobiaceae bacterium]|nr:VOC family protein [Rhizobiaceae bacterium]
MAHGIHHVTLITRKVQANVDFYAGFLGLRLVKRTAGFEDANQLHLIYGDAAGSPGTLVTFLVWEDGSPGRVGLGQISEIALVIDPASIGFWLTRALTAGVAVEGPADEFGEPVLRLKDPDGIIVKLVGTHHMRPPAPFAAKGIPEKDAVGPVRAVTILAEDVDLTAGFLTRHFGYREGKRSEAITRLVSPSGDTIDLRQAAGFWTSAPGTGTVDHVALRASDIAEIEAAQADLATSNASATTAHDRKYFHSLYVREPGGVLIELATDGPGMTVDEPAQQLGERLFFPPGLPEPEEDMAARLPQFGMPGEPRTIYRDLPFVHRLFVPENPDGSTLVLMHGSGGNETSLLSFGRRVAPKAKLLAPRGRSVEEGAPRWFRRFPGGFDQADIRAEAEAFAAFVEGAASAYGIDLKSTTFLGQSNGANFIAAFMLLHPGHVRRAALLRPVPVLEASSSPDLAGSEVLVVLGSRDSFLDGGRALAAALRDLGAAVQTETVDAGHDLSDADIGVVANWLAGLKL